MNTTTPRSLRSALGLGVSLAVVATGLTVVVSPLASAVGTSGIAPVVARPAAVHPASVHATVVKAGTGPASAFAQGLLGSASNSTSTCADPTCDLFARVGSVTVPTSASTTKTAPVWSFQSTEAGTFSPASQVLVGTVGQTMTVRLYNTDLPAGAGDIELAIPDLDGFYGKPDATATAACAPACTAAYLVTPTRAGTYEYEAGLTANGSRQAAMGLVGALVVRPASGSTASYDLAQSTDAFDDEAVLVYTDLDTAFAAAPLAFNMREYKPDFHLINGSAYPNGNPVSSDLGRTVMLHVVNGSITEKSPTILGTRWEVVGRGARPLRDATNPTDALQAMSTSGRTVNPGDTFDASVAMPTTQDTRYAIYDAPGHMSNRGWINGTNSPALGGSLTWIQTGTPVDTVPKGATVTGLTATGQPGGDGRPLHLSATFDGGDISDAAYYLDSASATGVPITGVVAGSQVTWDVDATSLSSGMHTIWVRGATTLGGWGPFATVNVRVDNNGPLVTGVVLNPTITNGGSNIDVTATVDDSTTGGSVIPGPNGSTANARAWVDSATVPDTTYPLATNGPRITAAAAGTFTTAGLLSGLTEGTHTLYIQGRDTLGLWGTPSQTDLVIDKTAPTTQGITLTPAYSNGLTGNPAKPTTIGISATLTDGPTVGKSGIVRVEAYLAPNTPGYTVPATGNVNGIALSKLSAPLNQPETWVADMPLSWLAGYAGSTDLRVWVVGLDAAGNRGPGVAVPFLLDKTKPTVTAASAVQGGTANTASSTGTNNNTLNLGITVADPAAAGLPGSGISRAEYFIGGDPGLGAGTQITVNGSGVGTATLNLNTAAYWSGGPIVVGFRVRDLAGNWSLVTTRSLTLAPVILLATGFETGQPAFNAPTLPAGGLSVVAGGIAGNSLRALVNGASSLSVAQTMPGGNGGVGDRFYGRFVMSRDTTFTTGGTNNWITVYSVGAATGAYANGVQVQYNRATPTANSRFRVCVATGTVAGSNPAAPVLACSNPTTATSASQFTISLDWDRSGATPVATLRVNGVQTTRTGAAAAFNVTRARLGVPVGVAGATGTLLFDTYSSARAPH